MTNPTANKAVAVAKIGTLEVGRGLAALAVVMQHAAQASDAFTSPNRASIFDWGIYGVDYFFVLSGFIIYHIHQNDPRRVDFARRFLIKRLRRIYVPYLPIAVVLISAYLILPGLSQGNRDWGWFTSITLLPSDSPPALSVAWTLTFEMIFYLFFLSFYVTRYFRHLVLGWVLLVLIVAGFDLNAAPYGALSRTLLDPLILEFVAGMVAAHYFGKLRPAYWYMPLVLGGGSFYLPCCPIRIEPSWGWRLPLLCWGLLWLRNSSGSEFLRDLSCSGRHPTRCTSSIIRCNPLLHVLCKGSTIGF